MKPSGRLAILMLGDIAILNIAALAALSFRFDGDIPPQYLERFLSLAPYYTLGGLVVFALFRLYSSLWRYASVDELANVSLAAAGCSIWLAVLLYGFADASFPRSIVPISGMATLILTGAWRLSIRIVRRLRMRITVHPTGPRVLVVGAGDAGAMLVDEFQKHGVHIVGFIDDDPAKQNKRIRGFPVLGTRADIAQLADAHSVDELIIAMPSAPPGVVREIVEAAKSMKGRIRTLPALHELASGKVAVAHLRPINVVDLLGRPPVEINLEEVAGYLKGRRVLVTGAGGSIGSELCRQVARFGPSELILLGHGENSIFEAVQGLRYSHPAVSLRWVIADVRDTRKIHALFQQFQPSVVFHAAAHKHVTLMEQQPDEAVKTNVFGTLNVAQAAVTSGVERFVLISTDKAVNPTSVMGTTKRVAELIVQDLNRMGGTKFVAVRFGNVLGSRGSVVPVFQRQIAQGGPITVTDPEMQRYFMTIPEAVQLVIQAAALGKGGEGFVLDMGEPVKIVDLATTMIRLSGLEPGKDIKVVFTGRRPGEKLFEEVLTAEEGTDVTRHKRIFVARTTAPDRERLQAGLHRLEDLAFRGDAAEVPAALAELVPTYEPESVRAAEMTQARADLVAG